jgi:PAS domain S-box-containing protein
MLREAVVEKDTDEPAGTETGSAILDEVTLRTLIEHVPLTVYIDRLDETGSNVYTSPRLESELGYTVEEWVSDKELYTKVLHPEDRDRVLAEYVRMRDSDAPFRAEYRMIARDGTVHWYLDEAAVIRDETSRPAYFHGFLLDITEQKALAEALRSSEEELRRQKRYVESLVEINPTAIVTVDRDGSRPGTSLQRSCSATRGRRRSGATSTTWSSDETTCAARP